LNSLNVNTVLNAMEDSKAGVKLLFLDACRDNPFARSFRSSTGGDLGKIGTAPSGTLINYATRPGSVASDGVRGGNGLYTEHLLKWLDSPNMPIETMLKKVALGVERDSNGKQEPWSEGQLKGEFYFSPQSITTTTITDSSSNLATEKAASQTELVFWNSVKDSNSPAELQTYISRYPGGMFSELASSRIARLNNQKTPPEVKKPNQPDTGLLIFKSFMDLMMKDN